MKKRLSVLLVIMIMCSTIFGGTTVTARAGSIPSDSVDQLINQMSLRDKVMQMMMVDFRKWGSSRSSAKDFTVMNNEVRNVLQEYNFGSVILFANNIKATEQSFNLVMGMQSAVTDSGGIPMIISTDQEGGRVYRLGSGSALPGNMALGATYYTNGKKYAYEAGKILGSELSCLGINNNLSPVIDVNNNPNNPVIGLRSYSDDSAVVGELASAVILGMKEYSVIGCAKHFPGHGDTETDSHYGLPIVDKSESELYEVELKPYRIAIDQGVDMIMTAHILYPALEKDKIISEKTGKAESLPATLSDDIIFGLLKKKMGFKGIVVTDSMNMAGISENWNSTQAIITAISAGIDMVMMPYNLYCKDDVAKLDKIIDAVIDAVESGKIEESRIDDAVKRILAVKEKNGILDWDKDNYSVEKAFNIVGSYNNRQMERKIASAAVTLVKNEDEVLPLDISEDSRVLCVLADESSCAQPIMAWNRAKQAKIIPSGAKMDYYCIDGSELTSDGINKTLKAKVDSADKVIVFSEISSVDHMQYKHWKSKLPNEIIKYAEDRGLDTIIVSCDKPYDVQMYPDADAVMAVYGCKPSLVDPDKALDEQITNAYEAYGPNLIAAVEVALGTYGASGKLPVDIPLYDADSNGYHTELVYERGYGLTYMAKQPPAFTKQPTGRLFSLGELCEMTWETNFEPIKCIIVNLDSSKVISEVSTGEKSVLVEAGDGQYIVKAYYGSGVNDYVKSDPFYANNCVEHVYGDDWQIEKPATVDNDGLKYRICLSCGEKSAASVIKAISSVRLTYNKKVYTGSAITEPTPIVKDSDGETLVAGTDYDVTSQNDNLKVGQYTVTVTFKGEYAGSEDMIYIIVPKKSSSATAVLSKTTIPASSRYDDIRFSWKSCTGASGYRVYYKKASSNQFTYITSTTKTNYTKKDLSDGVKYVFKVIPYYNSGSTMHYSAEQYITASVYTLKKIKEPVVIKRNAKVKVKWSNIYGETGYQISKSTSKNGTNIVATCKTTSGTYKLLKATKGKKYYYKVRAYKVVENKAIYGPWSMTTAYER